MPSLPPLDLATQLPRVTRARGTSSARAGQWDAIFVIVADVAQPRAFADLPEPERWRELHARSKPRSGAVRSTALANSRHTLAVIGYLQADASPFERLQLAGRMLKESSARAVDTVALAAADRASGAANLEALLAATFAHSFALPSFRSAREPRKPLREIVLLGGDEVDIRQAEAAARGNNLTRWLTALPPNKLDARSYRKLIADIARTNKLSMRFYDEAALRRLGAGAFLAVAAANEEPGAGIVHLRYRPARAKSARSPDVALVGKGIIFDTGGINLKQHKSMLDMHTDMSGSAVALATLVALAELKAPFAVDAWLAITENRIGPHGYKPQDIVRASNGVTIQVIHTDAEGRMALADTLALAGRTQPKLMIDYATLTGASVYALTERMSSVFTNRPALANKLVEAGRASGERVWNFPFEPDFDSDLESKVADIVQCAVDGKGDHILAARFLSRFVPDNVAWAHVDLSSATRSGGLGHISTEVTGFGVRFTLEALLRQGLLDGLERPK